MSLSRAVILRQVEKTIKEEASQNGGFLPSVIKDTSGNTLGIKFYRDDAHKIDFRAKSIAEYQYNVAELQKITKETEVAMKMMGSRLLAVYGAIPNNSQLQEFNRVSNTLEPTSNLEQHDPYSVTDW